MNLARRAVDALLWSGTGTVVVGVVHAVRVVILARLLPIEAFGIYAMAASVVALTALLPRFGLDAAYVHRAVETEDEERAATMHFTLTVTFGLVWAATLALAALAFTDGGLRLALMILCSSHFALLLTQTPHAILVRRVQLRRITLTPVVSAITGSVLALVLAFRGASVGALLAMDVAAAGVHLLLLYSWRPVWRPRIAWSRDRALYFLRFGGRVFAGRALQAALDRFDILWTGAVLDSMALGLYSRARTFGLGPLALSATPIASAVVGAYAELKSRPEALSRAVYWTAFCVFRVMLLIAGLVFLDGRELVTWLFGERWLAIVPALQALLPALVAGSLGNVLAQFAIAVGRPGAVAWARFWQLLLMTAGCALLTGPLGILGIAASVASSSVLGLVLLARLAREQIALPLWSLLAPPLFALAPALALGARADVVATPGPVSQALLRGLIFCVVYLAPLVWFERTQIVRALRWLRTHGALRVR
jgi:O-antigen/teichoic acid export membrane protein